MISDDQLRKQAEREFHDHHRADGDDRPNNKFYSITSTSNEYLKNWLAERCSGRQVLDYGCGDGDFTIWLASVGANAHGVDISPVSVENGRAEAARQGLGERVHLAVMDAEAMEYEDDTFDLIVVNGVLHHLELNAAYRELARVLKPDGTVIASEALRHNPLIRWYRQRTRDLRTAWEIDHVLGKPEIVAGREYFNRLDVRTFHLLSIAAVPFRRLPGFSILHRILAGLDSAILRLPGVRWQAWIAIFTLSGPRKHSAHKIGSDGLSDGRGGPSANSA